MERTSETPDFRPLYAQIRDLLMQRLADGRWRAGDLLPAEPRLAVLDARLCTHPNDHEAEATRHALRSVRARLDETQFQASPSIGE